MDLQSPSLFADRILHIELIYEPIFDASSAATLLRLARTCRAGRHAIAAYIRSAFDVNRLLARFFPSPTAPCSSVCSSSHTHSEIYDRARAFRTLQARTGTLISGSTALQFFDRTVYPESDLDLYVHMRHRREVGRWLLEEGYQFAPSQYQDPRFEIEVVHGMSTGANGIYRMPGVSAVLTFTKPVPRKEIDIPDVVEEQEESMLKVQVIVAKNTPMEAILAFHSTCVMNVISYEKAYCLFPWATLEARRSLLSSSCRGRSKWRESGLLKYANRGFTIISDLDLDEIEIDPASAVSSSSTLLREPSVSGSRYPERLSHAEHLYGALTALSLLSGTPSSDASTPAPRAASKSPPAFRLGWRWIDDSGSWVLPLPLAGVARATAANTSTPAHDPVAVCNWEVRYASGRVGGVVMHFEVATGKVLRYRYLVTDEALLAYLGRELSARMRAEEVKAREELEDWTYYDDELPVLCRRFLHGLASRRIGSLGV
ncbi:hypothetical protein C8Q79DRAFT_411333 [Trametes meyenii]|nr:hypothetical protein C8Q79DRAFT_411333 [Trametes meyenii]